MVNYQAISFRFLREWFFSSIKSCVGPKSRQWHQVNYENVNEDIILDHGMNRWVPKTSIDNEKDRNEKSGYAGRINNWVSPVKKKETKMKI